MELKSFVVFCARFQTTCILSYLYFVSGAAIEFMDDPAAVKSYFGEVLKIPPRVSDAILRANFSYSKVCARIMHNAIMTK